MTRRVILQFIKNTRVGAKLGIMIFIAFVALAAMAGLGYYELQRPTTV